MRQVISLPEDMANLIVGYEPDLNTNAVDEVETPAKFQRATSHFSRRAANISVDRSLEQSVVPSVHEISPK